MLASCVGVLLACSCGIADQVLRLAGQPGLIQDGDLIGVIPGIAGYAAADIVAHQRDRGGQVAALGQQTRQLAGVRRGFGGVEAIARRVLLAAMVLPCAG